jgi:hypothetical protein
MDTRNSSDLPTATGLERLRQRLERWRRTRKPPSRIPDAFWVAAVTMVKTYGVNRTARTLRLDYYSLKKRVDQGTAATSGTKPVPMPFVELANLPTAGPCLCRLELENADGVKMRVQLRSVAMPDLAAISRSFWNQQP